MPSLTPSLPSCLKIQACPDLRFVDPASGTAAISVERQTIVHRVSPTFYLLKIIFASKTFCLTLIMKKDYGLAQFGVGSLKTTVCLVEVGVPADRGSG